LWLPVTKRLNLNRARSAKVPLLTITTKNLKLDIMMGNPPANNNLSVIRNIPRSGALPHLKVRRIYSKWEFYSAPRCAALVINTASPCLSERRSANDQLKLVSLYSSWLPCSALGCLEFIHPHACGVLNCTPPPPRLLFNK
jgi:hypothetical protein